MEVQKHKYLHERIEQALGARAHLLDPIHASALRLFNGFYEGCPELVVDLYGRTLVLFSYAQEPEISFELLQDVQGYLLEMLAWVDCVVQKIHTSKNPQERKGLISFGRNPCDQVMEHGIWYAVDLRMNQDTSLYLDTRNLRGWLLENARDWDVLNTFAYTGSLGVAALAGGASRVVQVDRSRKFLELSRRTCTLNHLEQDRMELAVTDFFSAIARFKRNGDLFDCVVADPPFFSTTDKGMVSLVDESTRIINKLRPLVKDGGRLVIINNALFLSGVDYLSSVQKLCRDGYLAIKTILPAPEDFIGYPQTVTGQPPADPAPFNHPTKMVVFRVKRK